MKYRDHSLRYTPRPSVQKTVRLPASEPQKVPEPIPESDGHFVRVTDNEPLFNVHEKTSRVESFKDTVGGVHHVTKEVLLPFAKRHSKRLYHASKPAVAAASKKTISTVRSKSGKLGISKKRALQIIAVVVIFAGGYAFAHKDQPASKPRTAGAQSTSQEPIGGTTPQYDTILPKGKSIESLGGWSRVSPPSGNPVFAYVDTVERVEISVSEQPMPDSFSNNPDEDVKELALGFNAKDRFVADDATVYFVGTSTKGPQSIIFTKKNTLVLIKSPVQIKEEVWSTYIAELQ